MTPTLAALFYSIFIGVFFIVLPLDFVLKYVSRLDKI